MTPEEIQDTLQQMLAVQRQIQESQIKNTNIIDRLEAQTQRNSQLIERNSENIQVLVEEIAKLTVDRREKFNQFYGYNISTDSERLNIIERLIKVEQELASLKQLLDKNHN